MVGRNALRFGQREEGDLILPVRHITDLPHCLAARDQGQKSLGVSGLPSPGRRAAGRPARFVSHAHAHPPAFSITPATSRRPLSETSPRTSFAPCEANSMATLRPMPEPAPVMRTTWSLRRWAWATACLAEMADMVVVDGKESPAADEKPVRAGERGNEKFHRKSSDMVLLKERSPVQPVELAVLRARELKFDLPCGVREMHQEKIKKT